jgi:hypothetical protein
MRVNAFAFCENVTISSQALIIRLFVFGWMSLVVCSFCGSFAISFPLFFLPFGRPIFCNPLFLFHKADNVRPCIPTIRLTIAGEDTAALADNYTSLGRGSHGTKVDS